MFQSNATQELYPSSILRLIIVSTYVGGLLVVVNVVHISSQAEVCNLHHVVLSYQNIPGRKIPMDTLATQTERGPSFMLKSDKYTL